MTTHRRAAIAQWIRVRLPSCVPEFESQAHMYAFSFCLKLSLYCERNENKRKRGRSLPRLKKMTTGIKTITEEDLDAASFEALKWIWTSTKLKQMSRLSQHNRLKHIPKKWAIPGLFFFIFVFSTVNSKYVDYKILLMTGFEPQTSGIGSDRSANWATPAALFTSYAVFFASVYFSTSLTRLISAAERALLDASFMFSQ